MPTTPAGKQVSAHNAVKHGIFSSLRVLPGQERQADWDAHLHAILADLQPHGPIEAELAADLAFLFWRKRRLRRAEHALLLRAQEQAAWEVGRDYRRFEAGSAFASPSGI